MKYMNMKRKLCALMAALLLLAGCGNGKNRTVKMDTLTISFAPVMNATSLYAAAQPLGLLIQEKMLEHGYEIGEVRVLIGSSNETVMVGLDSGDVDVAIVPSSAYGQSDSVDIRPFMIGLSTPMDCDDVTVEDLYGDLIPALEGDYACYQRSYLYVNAATETGRKLLEKAEAGQLTYKDVNAVRWSVGAPGDELTYLYPSFLISKMFGLDYQLSGLKNVTGFGTDFENLSALIKGETDIIAAKGNVRKQVSAQTAFRIQYQQLAQEGKTINDVIKIIGVCAPVLNQVMVASGNKRMTNELITSLQAVFADLLESGEAAKALKILGLKGFAPCTADDLKIVREVYGK